MLLGGQTTELHMYEYLPFLPIASYSTGFGFPVVRLSRKPHPSQMRLARLLVRLEEGKVVADSEEFFRTVCSHSPKFQHVTTEQWR